MTRGTPLIFRKIRNEKNLLYYRLYLKPRSSRSSYREHGVQYIYLKFLWSTVKLVRSTQYEYPRKSQLCRLIPPYDSPDPFGNDRVSKQVYTFCSYNYWDSRDKKYHRYGNTVRLYSLSSCREALPEENPIHTPFYHSNLVHRSLYILLWN